MGTVTDVAELERRRVHACRLAPGRALETFEDAVGFLAERGLLTRTADSALPSLFEACQEEPLRPGGRGFAAWPATTWWWAGALEQEPGVTVLKIHNGKHLMLTAPLLALVDPICRTELDRFLAQPLRSEQDRLARRLLEHLAAAGPSPLDAVQSELGLHARALRQLRHPLERCGALASRQVVRAAGDGHVHTSELYRYDQLVPTPAAPPCDPRDALEDLVVAGLRAAVLAPARELARWFSWRWYARPDLIARLVDAGRIVPVGEGLVAAS